MPRRSALVTRIHFVFSQAAVQLGQIIEAELDKLSASRPAPKRGRPPGKPALTKRRGRPPKDAAATNGHAKNGRAARGIDDGTVAAVLKTIQANPGLRSEQLYAKVSVPAAKAKKALEQLRSSNQVKTAGKARATTYTAR